MILAYILDTSIAIHVRDGTDEVLDRMVEHEGQVLLSALSLAELERGVYRRPDAMALRRARLDEMLKSLPVASFDAAAASMYGQIIAQCGWVKGRDFDRMIGAHAISTGSILVTDNEADFRDIPGLSLENWVSRGA